jgi:hypothetical protein
MVSQDAIGDGKVVTLGSTGRVNELHSRFSRSSSCLTTITSITGTNYIIPGMSPPSIAGDDMVQGEFLILLTTILADISIPVEHFCLSEFRREIGAFDEIMQPDD